MTLLKEKVISFVKENLGKEINVNVAGEHKPGMIVGYNKGDMIVSFTEDLGWYEIERGAGDVLLLYSPLNVT